jgi:hypothetical protein
MTTRENNPVPYKTHLCKEYDTWLEMHKLPKMSADELACELVASRDNLSKFVPFSSETLIKAQLAWLTDFIERWDNAAQGIW